MRPSVVVLCCLLIGCATANIAQDADGHAVHVKPKAGDDAAPEVFVVEITVETAGVPDEAFSLEIHPEWAPLGASRFLELVEAKYYDGGSFFRVLKGEWSPPRKLCACWCPH